MSVMHEVDHEIVGDDMQFVRIELDPGEAVVAEAGSMMYIEDGIEMETIFGDGSAQSKQGGLVGTLLGAGRRILMGESHLHDGVHEQGEREAQGAFARPTPARSKRSISRSWAAS